MTLFLNETVAKYLIFTNAGFLAIRENIFLIRLNLAIFPQDGTAVKAWAIFLNQSPFHIRDFSAHRL